MWVVVTHKFEDATPDKIKKRSEAHDAQTPENVPPIVAATSLKDEVHESVEGQESSCDLEQNDEASRLRVDAADVLGFSHSGVPTLGVNQDPAARWTRGKHDLVTRRFIDVIDRAPAVAAEPLERAEAGLVGHAR